MENWRDIAGYEGRYQVSDLGRVRSIDRLVRLWTQQGGEQFVLKQGRVLKPGTYASGHRYVYLGRGSENRYLVHRLVLMTFVGPCPEGQESLHGPDHEPSNNRLDNLRWGTRSQNLIDDYARKHRFVSLTAEQVAEIKARIANGVSRGDVYQMALEYGCNPGTMHKIVHGEGYAHLR